MRAQKIEIAVHVYLDISTPNNLSFSDEKTFLVFSAITLKTKFIMGAKEMK